MEIMQAIANRRSIRSYKPDAIEKEKLLQIAEAFRLAPSARNLQNWQLLCVCNEGLRQRIRAEASLGQAPMLTQAPAILVAVGFSQDVMNCGHRVDTVDLSIAMSYASLAAEAVGLGTCWMASYKEDAIRDILQLPTGTSIVAITPLGYANETPDARPRKGLDEVFRIID